MWDTYTLAAVKWTMKGWDEGKGRIRGGGIWGRWVWFGAFPSGIRGESLHTHGEGECDGRREVCTGVGMMKRVRRDKQRQRAQTAHGRVCRLNRVRWGCGWVSQMAHRRERGRPRTSGAPPRRCAPASRSRSRTMTLHNQGHGVREAGRAHDDGGRLE